MITWSCLKKAHSEMQLSKASTAEGLIQLRLYLQFYRSFLKNNQQQNILSNL